MLAWSGPAWLVDARVSLHPQTTRRQAPCSAFCSPSSMSQENGGNTVQVKEQLAAPLSLALLTPFLSFTYSTALNIAPILELLQYRAMCCFSFCQPTLMIQLHETHGFEIWNQT